jgi:tetratricopeptide (TPR) repeat protein
MVRRPSKDVDGVDPGGDQDVQPAVDELGREGVAERDGQVQVGGRGRPECLDQAAGQVGGGCAVGRRVAVGVHKDETSRVMGVGAGGGHATSLLNSAHRLRRVASDKNRICVFACNMRHLAQANATIADNRRKEGHSLARPPKPLDPASSGEALFGAELRRQRGAVRLTLAALASQVGCSGSHLGNVERARFVPSLDLVAGCDRALQANGRLVELYHAVVARAPVPTGSGGRVGDAGEVQSGHADGGGLDHNLVAALRSMIMDESRRAFLTRLFATAGVLLIPSRPVARASTPPAGPRPSRIDLATVAELRAITAGLRRMDDRVAAGELFEPAEGNLRLVQWLLAGGPSPAVRVALAAAASELAGFLGWLSLDLDDVNEARGRYRDAVQFAEEADDPQLHAYMLGTISVFEAQHGDPREGRDLAGAARRAVDGAASPTLLAWLATQEADVQARNQGLRACLQALDQADRAVGQIDVKHPAPWPWVHAFDHGKVAAARGTCMLTLGRYAAAERGLRQALAALPESRHKPRALLLAELATAHVAQGHLDEACHVAGQGLAVAADTQFRRGLKRYRSFGALVGPHGRHPAVRDFHDQLQASGF